MHAGKHAMIATLSQGKSCDGSNCEDRNTVVYGRMKALHPDDLKRLLKEHGKKQVDLANLLGVDPTAVSKIFSGIRAIQASEEAKIRAWLGIGGQVEGFVTTMIPIIGQVAAGSWREAIENPIASMPAPDPDIPPHTFGLVVDGDSMDKVVENGGTVLVDPNDTALYPGRFYVVGDGEGQTTFKQFLLDPARLEPCSSNVTHQAIIIGDGTSFHVVGRVIWRASRM
ncbi:LexA family protein [Sphingomonas hankookensis]|uniref:LexA family protein n=1 Tax=Sphingomonas hankookensis TaxID=563996 RepID=UPI00234F7A74|nr:XRE family transcriptional regulator [Sphingomonas hankookensis]WCP71573.1 XRE family transcriptional regulator [Sphingomonas hankookensis]